MAQNYVVVVQLSKRAEFLQVPKQRQRVTELTLELLTDVDSSDFDQGHRSEVVLNHELWCSTNILLKYFCPLLDDKSVCPRGPALNSA